MNDDTHHSYILCTRDGHWAHSSESFHEAASRLIKSGRRPGVYCLAFLVVNDPDADVSASGRICYQQNENNTVESLRIGCFRLSSFIPQHFPSYSRK